MPGALFLPDRKQLRFISLIGLLLAGQLAWPVFGLATAADAIATSMISGICASAGIGFVRTAKRALQRSEKSRIEIFRSVPVGLFRVSPNGQLIDANPALADMLLCDSHRDLVGYNVGGLYQNPAEWNALAERLRSSDAPQRFADQLVRRDGKVIWVRGHAQAIRVDGDVVYHEGARM